MKNITCTRLKFYPDGGTWKSGACYNVAVYRTRYDNVTIDKQIHLCKDCAIAYNDWEFVETINPRLRTLQ